MSHPPAGMAASLLASFQTVCTVLETENALLKAGRLREVVDMLPAKQREMDTLESVLAAGRADSIQTDQIHGLKTPEIEAAAGRFGALVEANRTLLKNAIDAQNVLIRLIVVDATQDAGIGYGASGQYMSNPGMQAALTLRSDV